MTCKVAPNGTHSDPSVCPTRFIVCGLCWIALLTPRPAFATRHPVPREHPRLLGSRQELKDLAKERAQAYQRVVAVARQSGADDYSKMISMALVCAIDDDRLLGQAAVEKAMKYITGPIRKGHTTFGTDLAWIPTLAL